MGKIIPKNKLSREQIIKVFSNPVSGIIFDFEKCSPDEIDYIEFVNSCIKNDLGKIRYSKSMLVNALNFWKRQLLYYYWNVKRIYNPLQSIDPSREIESQLAVLSTNILIVKGMPDSFLFSHRHIREFNVNNYRKYNAINLAHANYMLNKKYGDINGENWFRAQEQTMDHFTRRKLNSGIEFTIFPNEHPYIARSKISKVGKTSKGNIYVMHKRKVHE